MLKPVRLFINTIFVLALPIHVHTDNEMARKVVN